MLFKMKINDVTYFKKPRNILPSLLSKNLNKYLNKGEVNRGGHNSICDPSANEDAAHVQKKNIYFI